jgi:hypothetical protein
MTHAVRGGALLAVLLLSIACRGGGPASPTPRTEATIPAPTPPPSGPSRVFAFDHELSYPVSDYTRRSRFVLYDNGTFVLEFPVCNCQGEYRGTYTAAAEDITFNWEGWSVAGPWGATGTLEGDILTVRYNAIMQLTDFEEAVYRRVP